MKSILRLSPHVAVTDFPDFIKIVEIGDTNKEHLFILSRSSFNFLKIWAFVEPGFLCYM